MAWRARTGRPFVLNGSRTRRVYSHAASIAPSRPPKKRDHLPDREHAPRLAGVRQRIVVEDEIEPCASQCPSESPEEQVLEPVRSSSADAAAVSCFSMISDREMPLLVRFTDSSRGTGSHRPSCDGSAESSSHGTPSCLRQFLLRSNWLSNRPANRGSAETDCQPLARRSAGRARSGGHRTNARQGGVGAIGYRFTPLAQARQP